MALHPAKLESAIAEARASTAGTCLWDQLVRISGADPMELRAALAEQHGIGVLSREELERASREQAALDPRTGTALGDWWQLGATDYLVAPDPWHPGLTAHLARKPGAVLAIAQTQAATRIQGHPALSKAASRVDPVDAGETSPVVKFVDEAILHACAEGASDIHFETDRSGLGVKYRVDGVMAPGPRLNDPQRGEEVISRIKVMAQLDITERRRPQDGRIHFDHPPQASLNLRVSIMPSIFGEDAVLRLLDRAQLRHAQDTISLDALGFDEDLAARIRNLAARPHGMLLVTGPTGSGKTTTVYAALSEANNGLEKIVTIEDPVEYELAGVLQIPVNEQKGLTFATGLRSILRHDPDRILVGEIRDAETAEIAVQASLTGHLVMTTVHANSFFDVLGRFQHFGIDPFGLASALNGVVVQRLLRKLCLHCASTRKPTGVEQKLLQQLGANDSENVPQACGCDKCRGTGYKGRTVLAEVHELGDRARDLIAQRASMLEMRQMMYGDEAAGLLAKAVGQALAGITTLDEVRRVVG